MVDVAAVADGLHAGLVDAGVRHLVYLPDSVMNPLTKRAENDPEIATYLCAREDEGIAMAAGLFMAGKRSAVVMEASGIGYSALILARCAIQRTPVFVIASHGALLGEVFDYHGATIAAGRGVVEGLRINHAVLRADDDPHDVVRLALDSVHGQRTHFVIFVPPYLMIARKGSK
jgi:sulfopyruvate decarboxylase TPP-binding subunit